MVHADASNFAEGVTKEEAYEQVLSQATGLFDDSRNWVCNLANASSLLWHAYKSLPFPSNEVNWAGFYTLDPKSLPPSQPLSTFTLTTSTPEPPSYSTTSTRTPSPRLILGPFHGKVACQLIPFGRGVCGAAAATQTTQLVHDVNAFPGHIACDSESRSEIVVPIVSGGRTVAIIDVDCAVEGGFDEVDQVWLERLGRLIGESCDWNF